MTDLGGLLFVMLFVGFTAALPSSLVFRGLSWYCYRQSEDDAVVRARQWRRRAFIAEASAGTLFLMGALLFVYLTGGLS